MPGSTMARAAVPQPGSLAETRLFVGTTLERRFRRDPEQAASSKGAAEHQSSACCRLGLAALAADLAASAASCPPNFPSCRCFLCTQHSQLQRLVPVQDRGGTGGKAGKAVISWPVRCAELLCYAALPALPALPSLRTLQVNEGVDLKLEGEEAGKLWCLLR